jgi:uncharacterized protein
MQERRMHRAVPELRMADDGGVILEGYGAVFNRYSENLGGFVEQVGPGAFDDTLSRDNVVAGLVNHDVNWLLASTDSDTLELASDTTGLKYRMTLDPDDPDTLRAVAKVKTRKMRGSSFSFTTMTDGSEWSLTEQGFPLRTLLKVRLYDVGPVTFPAYPDTRGDDVAVALRSLSQQVGAPIEELAAAARSNELRSYLAESVASDDVDPEQHSSPVVVSHRRWRRPAGS